MKNKRECEESNEYDSIQICLVQSIFTGDLIITEVDTNEVQSSVWCIG